MTTASPRAGNLTQQTTERLADLVLGEFEPGSDLPSEATLAQQLGVSRLTVREAVKTLEARGLVEIRRGRRPIVAWPNPRPVGDFFAAAIRRDPSQLLDLLEVRHALEVHIASLAALRANRSAITALELALAAMRQPDEDLDPAAINTADLRFHEVLAAATGNQLLAHLMEGMEEPLRASRLQSLRGHLTRGGTVADVIAQHEAILDRVRARDAQGAGAAMREHLGQTARDLRAAFAVADTIDPLRPAARAGSGEEH
ncbi:FadR family transcriptional regulator [Natronosporangium hydrolyticum]|uniref:FadR family transcriptional regulator n=1 Tax=Natronosporangium hydrolyticum TaxID=2811111 RepID=A0A895YDV0_9ACTN|nr:FadR/GntR family transcriptional regulator [Natronosporangium hydrolyticum]QSB12726.1 FadR family transcriptional regulator [Natronosporangium hydrolyticum]